MFCANSCNGNLKYTVIWYQYTVLVHMVLVHMELVHNTKLAVLLLKLASQRGHEIDSLLWRTQALPNMLRPI